MELLHRLFLPIEKPSFSKKILAQKSHLNGIIKRVHGLNPLFLADDIGSRTLSLASKFCLQNCGDTTAGRCIPACLILLEGFLSF